MDYPLIGDNTSIRKIRELITMVSDTAFNVLLLGETGTGKEVVARLLHHESSRRERRFVKVNCAALPLNLLESELFGYERGAFTGADRQKPGKFELASGGVIFLDEIGDMPMVLQAKLLHVLQSGEFNRLGGTEDVKVSTWIIASTNRDLEADMKKGLFREDLYYRLNIIKIELPPLRERREDIPALTTHFIEKFRKDLGLAQNFSLNEDMEKVFQVYHWPGNVRELSSAILKLIVGDDPDLVKAELLKNMDGSGFSPVIEMPSAASKDAGGIADEVFRPGGILKSLKELKAEAAKHIEKKIILHALHVAGWNKSEAARMLKISYKALFYKMDELGIGKDEGAR